MAKATHLLRKAAELVRERQYQRAVEVYLKATETDPGDARAWFGLGVCLYRIGNLDVARIALERSERMGYPKASNALERLDQAEKRRAAQSEQKAAQQAAEVAPEEETAEPTEKLDLGSFTRIMLVEGKETDRRSITRALENRISHLEVASVPYGVSTSDTMSGVLNYDVTIMDWDLAPQAAAGLMQILRIKRPSLFIICLVDSWEAGKVNEVIEAGADLCVVKNDGYARVLPMIIAQWSRRSSAVREKAGARTHVGTPNRWLDAVEAVGDIILFIDADRTVLHTNQAAPKQLRRTEDELIGRSYSWILYNQERPPESCPIRRVLDTEQPAEGLVMHSETERELHASAWPVPSPAGRLSGVVAVLREPDTGPEQQAARSDVMAEVLSHGLDLLECGVVALDENHRVVWVNDTAAALLDGDAESVIGEGYREVVARHLCQALEAPQAFLEEIDRTFAEGLSLEDYHLKLTRGTRLSYYSTPTQGDAVRRLEHFYAAAPVPAPEPGAQTGPEPQPAAHGVAALPDMLFRAAADGTIEWCSAGAHQVLGRAPNSVQGTHLAELAVPEMEERVESLLDSCLGGARRISEEVRMQHAGGDSFWGELVLLPVNGREDCVEGVLRDVTDRKMAEAIRAIVTGETDL